MANEATNIFENLLGDWEGENKIFLEPEKVYNSSSSKATVRNAIDKTSVLLEYNLHVNNKPCNGLLLIKHTDNKYYGSWIDQWHMQEEIMQLQGSAIDNGFILVGSYAAGEERWGWEIEITRSSESIEINHYNVSPDGTKYLGVESIYKKTA